MLFSRYRRRPEESTDLCILHFVFTLYDDRLGPLGGHKVHKMVKFRPRGMVDKREMEQAQLFETADERGCTPMFGAAHRRASAVPYPRRYEVCSLSLATEPQRIEDQGWRKK